MVASLWDYAWLVGSTWWGIVAVLIAALDALTLFVMPERYKQRVASYVRGSIPAFVMLVIIAQFVTYQTLKGRADEQGRKLSEAGTEITKLKTTPEDVRVIRYPSIPREGGDYRTPVTIITMTRTEPTRLRVEFDGPVIGNVPFRLTGVDGPYEFSDARNDEGNASVMEIRFQRPVFAPETPLTFEVYSTQAVTVTNVTRLPYAR